MIRTVRYRLHPGSRATHRRMLGLAGACRFAWNQAIEKLRGDYAYYGQCDWRYFSLGKWFTIYRNSGYAPWLREYSFGMVRASLKPIETAYKEFFKDPKRNGLPRFHSQHGTAPSFPVMADGAKLEGGRLRIQKLGWVRLSRTGGLPYDADASEWKAGRIVLEHDGWHAYMQFEVPEETSLPHEAKAVGIDRNVGQIALSDGRIIRGPDTTALEFKRRRYQRKMARRVHGKGIKPSRRYLKAKAGAAAASAKMGRIRHEWAHQTSRAIANDYDVAVIEDLNIRAMSASAKGTAEAPGKNVAQKRGLNRSILSSSWGTLERCLSYKMQVLKVNPAYTSQTCHACGAIGKGSRRSQSVFKCLHCGHEANADVNAALNTLAAGDAAVKDRGVSAVGPAGKRLNDAWQASVAG